jgi:hypothetical protein
MELETVRLSIDRRMRKLQEELTTVKSGPFYRLNAAHTETQATGRKPSQTLKQPDANLSLSWKASRPGLSTKRKMNDACAVKPPKFDGTSSWTVFRRQFETVAEHNNAFDESLARPGHRCTARNFERRDI